MQIIKKQSKKTYIDKNGKDRHYYNYFIQFENGKRIQFKCAFFNDVKALDMVAVYEK